MNDIQHNIDRLAEIVANYVGTQDIGYDALAILEPLFDQLKPDETLRAFWNERFARAMRLTKKFV